MMYHLYRIFAASLLSVVFSGTVYAACIDTFRDVAGTPGPACETTLLKSAEAKGIRACLRKITGGPEVVGKILGGSSKSNLVASAKILNLNSNRCVARVRVVVKESALRRKVEELLADETRGKSVQATPVGAIVRTIIDGKVAEDVGFNTLYAIQALQQALIRKGFEVISLRDASMRFGRAKYTQTHGMLKPPKDLPPDRQRAYQSLREDTRDAVNRAYGIFKKRFDWLLAGEINLRAVGRDAQTGNFRYEVTGYLDVVDMQTLDVIATAAKSAAALGVNRIAAISNAIDKSVAGNASELAKQMREHRRQVAKIGTKFAVTLVGWKSVRKDVRPVVKALEAENILQVGSRSDDTSSGSSKLTVLYKGTARDFEEAVNAALDKLASRFTSIDYELNGTVLRIKLLSRP